MKLERILEITDSRDYAIKSYTFLVSLAREVGEENKRYVVNAINTIRAFHYNPAIVKKALNDVLLRLERKRATQLLNGNPFRQPDPSLLRGRIIIGNVLGSNATVSLSHRQINENIGIWGRAGSGKTNLVQLICLQLVKASIPVRIFDYKDEYRDLLPHIQGMFVSNLKYDRFNALEPVGLPKNYLQSWGDFLQQDFKLKPETKFMLVNYADELYRRYDIYDKGRIYPSLQNMKEFLIEESVKKTTSTSKKSKIYTCLEIINTLLVSTGEMLNCNSGYAEDGLSNLSLVSYEMSNLGSNIQSWLTKLRLKHLYHNCFSGEERDRLKIAIVFEEAKMLFSEDLHKSSTSIDYIKQLATQGRSSGFGLEFTDQNKNELADFVLNNLACEICFNLKSPKEIRATGYSMGCNEEQARHIQYLKIPYAIMSISGHPPFMIKIPKSPVSRHIADDELKELMQPKLASLNCISGSKIVKPRVQLSQAYLQPLQEKNLSMFLREIRSFLLNIQNQPELNVSQLYSSLNLSGRRGDKLKRQVLTNKLVQEEIIHTGKRKRPSKKLKLTEKGDKLLQWLEKRVKVV